MTKVLAYTSPARGHLFPVVPILLELHKRGHDVAVRTLDAHVGDLLALGLEARPLAPDVVSIAIDDWNANSPQEAQERAMRAFGRRAPRDAADLRSAIEEERPEVLLVDIMAFGALAEAEASGLPWASWLPYPAWLRGPGVPPYGPGLPPLSGPEGRARDAAVAPLVASPARNLTAAANAGRAAAGLEPLAEPDDVLLRPPLLISLTAEPFEYPRPSWPKSFLLVGPCSWEPPAPPPVWLTNDRRPVVLVSTSTEFQDDGRLVSTAFSALRDREDLLVVATVPAGNPAEYECPPNARIERFVPHAHLLQRAVAVVCHAGMGITQKALAAGVPVCAVPFGRDQLEVARRVEVAGAGVRLPAGDLSADRLRAAVERTITCRAGAKRVSDAFAAAGGASAAATAIEELGPANLPLTGRKHPSHRQWATKA
jgi:MGT family glycosyltransferase